jgi:transcriptional regulator with XRE-family HTH domain
MTGRPDLQALAVTLRALRKAKGYTQESFAYDAGLDRGFVGAAERGERNLGFRKLRQLMIGLGVTWVEFGAALHVQDPIETRQGARRRM